MRLDASRIPTDYRRTEYIYWLRDMKNFFERVIVGVAALPSENVVLDVDLYFEQLETNTLAQCGPGDGTWYNIPAYLSDLRFDSGTQTATVRHATMKFNTDYYQANPTHDYYKAWKRQFFTTAVHECFHACGIGSLWNGPFRIISYFLSNPIMLSTVFPYNVIGTGNPSNAQYTRAGALNEYRTQMIGQSAAASIPIENFNGDVVLPSNTIMINAGGTALAHWRGSYTGALSGIVNSSGQDMIDEVMTSWSNRNEGVKRWVSRFTIAALRDIGWEVNFAALDAPLHEWKSVEY